LKRTKLEDYLAILQLLQINQRPLQITEIQTGTRIESDQLEKDLTFLLEQKAIERRPLGVSHAFFVAPTGDKLLRYFTPPLTTG
jgi:predicted transcriptional regulator